MKFKLNTLFGTRNGSKVEEPDHDEQIIKDIINDVDGDVFGVSKRNVLYAKTSELGGYFYVIALIIGDFKIKTTKGATLNIQGENLNLLLKTDMDEFESDASDVAKRYVTRIDFQIEKEDVSKFDKTLIKTLQLSAKKKEIVFNTID